LEEQNRRIQADETGRTDPSRLKRKHRVDMNGRMGKNDHDDTRRKAWGLGKEGSK
jgi:hypothetical protein